MTTALQAQPRSRERLAKILSAAVAAVWLYHGLVNKLLHANPRHLQIVRSVPIFNDVTAPIALAIIGVCEILIALWILSGRSPQRCAAIQTAILIPMNVVEIIWARPHLLSPAGLLPLNIAFLSVAWIAASLRGDTCSTR
jgi:uncharacterized membrane protein YphA (DoxX/SURF4 family)